MVTCQEIVLAKQTMRAQPTQFSHFAKTITPLQINHFRIKLMLAQRPLLVEEQKHLHGF
jgi:hypothetical protein